jgi:hypothetical protein
VPEQLLEAARQRTLHAKNLAQNGQTPLAVPAGLDRFTYWLPEGPIQDDVRLPW